VKDRQFCDVGSQYRTAIFHHDEEQRRLAEESKANLERSRKADGPVYTEIVPAGDFYPAEEYHQEFYRKSPLRYGPLPFRVRQGQPPEGTLGRRNSLTGPVSAAIRVA
jgi:peptide methionine sulfoxide reductase MsrA